tara:strand:+ start:101928 stop:102344 length:417 start_codon:yes stop_codon:yes gene_type:complete
MIYILGVGKMFKLFTYLNSEINTISESAESLSWSAAVALNVTSKVAQTKLATIDGTLLSVGECLEEYANRDKLCIVLDVVSMTFNSMSSFLAWVDLYLNRLDLFIGLTYVILVTRSIVGTARQTRLLRKKGKLSWICS